VSNAKRPRVSRNNRNPPTITHIQLLKPHLFSLALLTGSLLPLTAAPPTAPDGYAWVRNEKFSDEFNAATLDTSKWFDHHPTWKGRPPAKFVPSGIAVTNGCLELRAGTLPKPEGPFTLAGAAVVSRSESAHFGYYEARMKAAQISMSSTFWLSGGRHRVGDDSVSQEIDITETVGAPPPEPEWCKDWNRFMNSNTHSFRSSNGKKESASAGNKSPLAPPANEAFHTYAAWWVDANTVKYYLDDEYQFTIHPKTNFSATPFSHPMHVNLVTETYDWCTPPSIEAATNPAINVTRYDWVRAYELVKADPTDKSAARESTR